MWALMHMNEKSPCGTSVVGGPETALPDSTLGKLDTQGPAHAAVANHRRISARGTTPVRSAMIIPPRKSTK